MAAARTQTRPQRLASAHARNHHGPARFAEELVLTKKRGYALDEEESMQGGRCIGVARFFRVDIPWRD